MMPSIDTEVAQDCRADATMPVLATMPGCWRFADATPTPPSRSTLRLFSSIRSMPPPIVDATS